MHVRVLHRSNDKSDKTYNLARTNIVFVGGRLRTDLFDKHSVRAAKIAWQV